MKAYDKAVASKNPEDFKALRSLPAYYRCAVYKWQKLRGKQCWPLICEAIPRLAKKHKELPDVLRDYLGHPKKFVNRLAKDSQVASSILPPEFEQVVAHSVVSWLLLYIYNFEVFFKFRQARMLIFHDFPFVRGILS